MAMLQRFINRTVFYEDDDMENPISLLEWLVDELICSYTTFYAMDGVRENLLLEYMLCSLSEEWALIYTWCKSWWLGLFRLIRGSSSSIDLTESPEEYHVIVPGQLNRSRFWDDRHIIYIRRIWKKEITHTNSSRGVMFSCWMKYDCPWKHGYEPA